MSPLSYHNRGPLKGAPASRRLFTLPCYLESAPRLYNK
jgi:hypothetical protein